MGYILRQYNHVPGDGTEDIDNENLNYFLNPILLNDSDITVDVKLNILKPTVTYISDEDDSGAVPGFQPGAHYYFHGLLSGGSGYDYHIKLENGGINANDKRQQYIKTIHLEQEVTDIEFIFTPVIGFEKIVFELDTSSIQGSGTGPTSLKLGVCEVDLIDNIMPTILGLATGDGKRIYSILKAGIQSHPGLLLCVNGTDIRLPHNGIYEVKNGVILVDFFSVVTPFTREELPRMASWIDGPSSSRDNIYFFPSESENPPTRVTDGFTIDYLYYVNDK